MPPAYPTVTGIAAVMVHVPDPIIGLDWYARAFPEATPVSLPEFNFQCLRLAGVSLEIVQADEKVGAGAMGLAVDWRVADFDAARAHLESLGATLYRGPMDIEDGLRMCKLRDPWGNLLGLRGP
ncbi:MAG: hypothetical protein ACI8RZ_007012 [Myxococcota bacterium]|jgi:hypothetical protein